MLMLFLKLTSYSADNLNALLFVYHFTKSDYQSPELCDLGASCIQLLYKSAAVLLDETTSFCEAFYCLP